MARRYLALPPTVRGPARDWALVWLRSGDSHGECAGLAPHGQSHGCFGVVVGGYVTLRVGVGATVGQTACGLLGQRAGLRYNVSVRVVAAYLHGCRRCESTCTSDTFIRRVRS